MYTLSAHCGEFVRKHRLRPIIFLSDWVETRTTPATKKSKTLRVVICTAAAPAAACGGDDGDDDDDDDGVVVVVAG